MDLYFDLSIGTKSESRKLQGWEDASFKVKVLKLIEKLRKTLKIKNFSKTT